MAKNPKTQQSNGTSSTDAAAPPTGAPTVKSAAAKSPKATKASGTKAPAKKTSAKSGTKKTTPRRPAKKAAGYEPTDDEIRIRAYFVAERRLQLALDGDPANDWIVARQQLIEEASQRSA